MSSHYTADETTDAPAADQLASGRDVPNDRGRATHTEYCVRAPATCPAWSNAGEGTVARRRPRRPSWVPAGQLRPSAECWTSEQSSPDRTSSVRRVHSDGTHQLQAESGFKPYKTALNKALTAEDSVTIQRTAVDGQRELRGRAWAVPPSPPGD